MLMNSDKGVSGASACAPTTHCQNFYCPPGWLPSAAELPRSIAAPVYLCLIGLETKELQEVPLHHSHDLVDRESGTDTLRRPPDGRGTAPARLELRELGKGGADV